MTTPVTPSAAETHNWITASVYDDGDVANVPDIESDAALARRLEQEERDAAYARHIQYQEQQQTTATPTGIVLTSTNITTGARPQQRKCLTCRNILSTMLLVVVVAVSLGVGLYFVFGRCGEIPLLDRFRDDPYDGVDSSDAPRWDTNGNSVLELEILNALQPEWDAEFNRAVDEWNNNGSPDVLSLTTRRVDIDSDCTPVRGKLKVCNGNYGNTNWYGLNSLLLATDGRTIRASTATLNDSLLDPEGQARKQYTMCHEIGHGFGLPHTDENFFNPNLGNCMDYTNFPSTNQSPDESNFAFLNDIYGDGSTTAAATVPNGGARMQPMESSKPEVSDAVMMLYSETMTLIENGNDPELIDTLASTKDTPHTKELVFDLGEGFLLDVNLLLKSDA